MARKLNHERKPRKFGDIFAKYKHYDPSVEGYGDPDQWREAFFTRMGVEEATRVVNSAKKTPRAILGLPETASWPDIKSAFRHLAMQYHPDRIANTGLTTEQATERFREFSAAYELLEDQHKKAMVKVG